MRVLIVDDVGDITAMMGILLGALGHEVRVACSGVQAIAIAEEFLPQCVILDIGLPDFTGYEVCRELRRGDHAGEVYIAAVTGWGTASDRVQALAAGFDAHFLKPINVGVVRDILDSAQLQARAN